MSLGALFCLLLAHFISDFLLQTGRMVDLRYSDGWGRSLAGNSLHAGAHFIVSLILTAYFLSWDMLLIAAVISVLHGAVDSIKSWSILRKPFRKNSPAVFLADQACHWLVIFLTLYFINPNPPVSSSVKSQLEKLAAFLNSSAAGMTYGQRLVLFGVLLLIGLWGVGIFIRILFCGIHSKPYEGAINLRLEVVTFDKKYGADDGGFIIGILERLFIIISIVLNMPLVIGFILTAKSVARLKKFDNDRFVEIFIIGSFISFISAIVIGYLMKALKVLPYVL